MPTILIKKSDTASAVPGTANLTNLAGGAEVAVNTADRRMFTMNSSSAVVELGTNPSSLTCADGSFTLLKAASASITNLTATSIVISNLSIASANVTTLTSASATITNLLATTLTVSSVGVFPAGTVSAPAITTSGDTNTGIFFPAADTIAFAEGGVEAARFNASGQLDLVNNPILTGGTANGVTYLNGSKVLTSGSALTFDGTNLGVGVASPAVKLDVAGAAGTGTLVKLANTTATANTNVVETNYLLNNSNSGLVAAAQIGVINPAATGNNYGEIYFRTAEGSTTLTTRMYLTAGGNLGIGTSSPGTRLDVSQANAKSATGIWQIQSFDSTSQTTGVGGGISFGGYKTAQSAAEVFAGIDGYKENSTAGNAAGALRFHTQVSLGSGLVERMRLDSSGNLGIGTTTMTSKLNVNGDIRTAGGGDLRLSNNGDPSITADDTFLYNDAKNLIVWTNGAERARITSGGSLLVNTTTTGHPNVVGIENTGQTDYGIVIRNKNSSVDDAIGFFNNSGTRVGFISFTTTATTYNTSSDRRLKDNIAPADDAGAVIDAIEVVKHDWKYGGHTRYGVVAQDLHTVAPEAVSVGDADSVEELKAPWSVDYSKLVPMLIKEVQSLRKRVAELEAK